MIYSKCPIGNILYLKGGDLTNINDLNAEIARNGLTIPRLAEQLGMDKKTLYSRMKGETPFRQDEIVQMTKILHLSEEMILNIFFADVVS